MLSSLCFVETGNRNTIHYADGKTNSYGVCQIKLEAAKTVGFKGTAKDLMNPAVNIDYAGKILRHQILRYQDVQKAVIAYNKGSAKGLTSSKYQAKVYEEWRHHVYDTGRYQYCRLQGRQ